MWVNCTVFYIFEILGFAMRIKVLFVGVWVLILGLIGFERFELKNGGVERV